MRGFGEFFGPDLMDTLFGLTDASFGLTGGSVSRGQGAVCSEQWAVGSFWSVMSYLDGWIVGFLEGRTLSGVEGWIVCG